MVFGAAFPAQLALEEAAFSRPLRLPGLRSERIAWEVLTGNDIDFGVEDYLSRPSPSLLCVVIITHQHKKKKKKKKSARGL